MFKLKKALSCLLLVAFECLPICSLIVIQLSAISCPNRLEKENNPFHIWCSTLYYIVWMNHTWSGGWKINQWMVTHVLIIQHGGTTDGILKVEQRNQIETIGSCEWWEKYHEIYFYVQLSIWLSLPYCCREWSQWLLCFKICSLWLLIPSAPYMRAHLMW